jgi:hypothetical protein
MKRDRKQDLTRTGTEILGAGQGAQKKAALGTAGSFIIAAQGKAHPELPAGARVRLRPLVTIGEGGRIDGIAVSGRTPSPFGKAMGDHTVAWQAVVDEVHACLYGKDLPVAIAALRQMHHEAWDWMTTRGTPEKLLLRDLGAGMAPRWQRLEDAVYHTTEHLNNADQATGTRDALAELARAIAYHLTYLNYLPFATVPAKSARGSHGSAEGWYRSVLTNYELSARTCGAARAQAAAAAAQAQAGALPPEQAQAVAQAADQADTERLAQVQYLAPALWALFDFAAALRESHIEHVLRPSIALDVENEFTAIQNLAERMKAAASQLTQAAPRALAQAAARVRDQLADVETQAEKIQQTAAYETFREAAGLIMDNSRVITSSLGELDELKEIARENATDPVLDRALKDAQETVAEIKKISQAAPDRAPRVLSILLHRHLQAVATAYPTAITDSGVLKPAVGAAAVTRLENALTADPDYAPYAAGQALAVLKDGVKNQFDTMETITVATDNEWVADAGTSPLVVTWDAATTTMTVNGRAPAPQGVAGMGCHTTAWILECQALNALIRRGRKADPPAKLAAAVLVDLAQEVAKLDELLPADQLEGGQLTELYQAAADVVAAKAPEQAGRSFLEFRNLMPFATVDEGDRGGHQERADASVDQLFDKKALNQCAETITSTLEDVDATKRLSVALATVADQLDAEAKKKDTDAWPPKVKTAARRSIKRLRQRAKLLTEQLDDGQLDADAARTDATAITNVRWDEHRRVYKLVHPEYQG